MANYTERRDDVRCENESRERVAIHIHRMLGERTETVAGELINLSRGGAKISLSACLRFAEVIRLQIACLEPKVNIDTDADVVWIRPAEDGEWLAGCSLAQKIPQVVIHRLTSHGIINRRRHMRHPLNIHATARGELDTHAFPVDITDYSVGGFCLVSTRPRKVGALVRIEIDGTTDVARSIYGEVCWQAERHGKYLLGCMMKSNGGFEILNDLSQ